MDLVLISSRADEKALENTKTGKVTMVVAVMHIFAETKSNSPNANAKNSAKKAKLGSKLKRLGLNRPKTHLVEAQRPPKDASKKLLVKRKTIRVCLDTGLSGDLIFLEKGSNRYIPRLFQSHGANGTFKTKRVGDVKLSFVEYSASKKVHLCPDIVEYPKEARHRCTT
jgi:hypothetical protein